MTTRRPSRPWRLVLSTPGAPIYETHRSKPAAYRAVEVQKQRIAEGISRVTRIAVEQWEVDYGRWIRYENMWNKSDDQPTTP